MSAVANQSSRKILLTSALPYANADVHIGNMVEHIQTDIWRRFQKMRGHECIAICADDTHGTPVMVRARTLGISPEQLIAETHTEHLRDFVDFGVEYDIYSSTHSDENRLLAEEFFSKMRAKGHIDVRAIAQLYCEHDKMFLPDRFVKGTCPNCATVDQYGDSCDNCGATYSPRDLKNPRCSICSTTPVERQSDHIFFRLNDFKSFVREWMPKHTQSDVANKLLEWFDNDLRDWDISRDAPYFGFEIPGFPGKYFYVWVDAPIGYISATWQWCKREGRDFDAIWRRGEYEIFHNIGKDITYFHLLFWPALLKAAEFSLPKQVFVHGHLTVNGEKMSKSKGTSIKARTYLKHLDPMYLRYYYATRLNGSAQDFDLSVSDFVNRVNSDLVGKITNLGSRGAQMLSKRIDGKMGTLSSEGLKLVRQAQERSETIAGHFEAREFARAIGEIREIADAANKYFDEQAPWNLLKTDVEATRAVLTATLNIFRLLAIYLQPVIPDFAKRVAVLLGEDSYSWASSQQLLEARQINEYQHLANRIEPEMFNKIIEESIVMESPEPKPVVAAAAAPLTSEIDFDEFAKIDLRIAKIIAAEEIVEADKLLRLKVNLGDLGERQIIAGIKSAYKADDLVGRLTVIVANLKPRKMKFGISEGMVLAAGPGGSELFILSPDSGAQPGQKVK